MDSTRVKELLDQAASSAYDARRRIEAAVALGTIPAWVLDACEQWERAALSYGSGIARREMSKFAPPEMDQTARFH